MTENEKLNKLKELNDNQEFIEKMADVTSDAELQALFAAYGVEFTEQEVHDMVAKAKDGEINADELDQVSGGVVAESVAAWTILTYSAGLVAKGAKAAWDLGKKATKYF